MDAQQVRSALEPGLRSRCECTVLTLGEFRERNGSLVDGMFRSAYALEVVSSVPEPGTLMLLLSGGLGLLALMWRRRRR